MHRPKYETEHRVNYADTDAGGVVYYGRYLEYLEAARMGYFSQLGCDPIELHHQEIYIAVREAHLTYRSSARLGDCLMVETELTHVTKYHVTVHSRILNRESSRLILEAEIKCISMNAQGKLLKLPDELLKAI